MRDGGHSLAYLVRRTGAAPSRISNHLRLMEEAGIIRTRKSSGGRVYSLRKEGLQQVQTFLDELLEPGGASSTTTRRRTRRRQGRPVFWNPHEALPLLIGQRGEEKFVLYLCHQDRRLEIVVSQRENTGDGKGTALTEPNEAQL